jgi:DNA-binding MarR family transcriptional regulator
MTLQSWVEVTMRRSMHNLIRHSKSMGFTMPQVNTLFRLHHHDQCSVSDLAEFLGVSDAAVSQMVDKLVDQGLILRLEDPQDRRGKLLSLSPEGNTVVQESIKARHAWVSDLAKLFTPEQEMQVQPALLLLIEKIKQMEAEQPVDFAQKQTD